MMPPRAAGLADAKLRLAPRLDRHGADRVGRRAVDDLRAHREIDQRVMRLVDHAVDARLLEEDRGLLREDLLSFLELGEIDIDRPDRPAGHREIRRVLVEAEGLAPAPFARL